MQVEAPNLEGETHNDHVQNPNNQSNVVATTEPIETDVAPGFKEKTRYTPYVSLGSQISHIDTNKGNINRQCLIYNILSIKGITLDSKIAEKTTPIFR